LRLLLVILALGLTAAASPPPPVPKDVQAVIDRSHRARGDYAVFLTTEVATPARRWTEVDAEFQHGAMHRIEVPTVRTIVNCDTGAETVYDVHKADYREDGSVGSTCGIAVDADPIVSARMLEPVSGVYGRADRIELIGEKFVRRYTVTTDGIIVGNDYAPRRVDIGFALRTVSVVVRRAAQPPAMFARESLARPFAPAADGPAPAP
jgi:hypothetical protein